jgi:hypothetical protein
VIALCGPGVSVPGAMPRSRARGRSWAAGIDDTVTRIAAATIARVGSHLELQHLDTMVAPVLFFPSALLQFKM